ncbi:MBL fold metallo-hydrolase [Elioraea sp.]|uniref:MBL fold metallo-hydrolase n=1 Tax=Elioraea sp. TaxID=2185103 RepID=UPI0021DCBDA7|nr:MBL fold metallo-hydrolase [Elioraea sp.]GIX11177.1 MAG: metal-dependent hydrolase [Elioraea sp.]
MRVTVLGCGGSGGVPLIGGLWGACDPAEPRNRRLRGSILVEAGDATILVDASPDLRAQLLAAGVRRIDAVIITHAHADHVNGLDDLRYVNRLMRQPIPLYADRPTLEELRQRFAYAFQPLDGHGFYRPVLEPREIVAGTAFDAAGVTVLPIAQDHGFMPSLGLRFGAFAYSTDAVRLDERAFAALAGIDTWIVGCFQETPHPTHAHLPLVLEWVARIRPRRTVLTHMSERLDYRALAARLPQGVAPAHDGMVLELVEHPVASA